MGKKRQYSSDDMATTAYSKSLVITGLIVTFLIVILGGFMVRNLKRRQKEELLARMPESLPESGIQSLLPTRIDDITKVYVIPGGGPGAVANKGYPEWTQKRTLGAFKAWNETQFDKNRTGNSKEKAVFFALSAGSVNAPNTLLSDGRVVFECHYTMQHLINLGVPENLVYGDFISWDTVGNGYSLRIFLEGIITAKRSLLRSGRRGALQLNPKPLIDVEVYSSDFHAERTKVIFDWLLSLEPSIAPYVNLNMFVTSHFDASWAGNKAEWDARLEHEQNAIRRNKALQKQIRNIAEFQAFLLMGGHQGYRNYLLGKYSRSSGAGW
jgi:hypothetical protein